MAVICVLACLSASVLWKVNAQLQWQAQQSLQNYRSPCDLLSATFPAQVSASHDKSYADSQAAYWTAQQAELTPECRFYPRNARDIAEALADIIIPQNVSIAVASGGHSSNTGASNIDHGITIDLARLNQVSLADKNSAVYLGPGARWEDVYAVLEPHNLTVSGGRVAHVGVGGYVLGGGLSWFASEHGWTCDSVLDLQVVTPRGQILWATEHYNDDIFYALKGSLGAFGIVTQIKMPTISNSAVYAGEVAYSPATETAKLFDALDDLGNRAKTEPEQSGYLSFAWSEARKQFEYTAYLLNTEGDSDLIQPFTAIPHKASSLRRTTIGSSAKEISKTNPPGQRRTKFTLTSKSSTKAMSAIHDTITSFTSTLKFDQSGTLTVTFQPLILPHLPSQPNIFNLNPHHGPLLLLLILEISWTNSSQDSYFETSSKNLRIALEKNLKDLSALHPFIYPNFAARDQNPFANLTPSQRGMLKAIQKKYDPGDVWRRLVPGIWHV